MKNRLAHLPSRVALPALQVLIAVALTIHNLLGPNNDQNPGWIQPDRTLGDAINAPAALLLTWLWELYRHFFPYRQSYVIQDNVSYFVFFGLVALLWYGVAVEIGGHGRSALMPDTWIRVPADIAAVVLSPLMLVVLNRVWQHISSPSFKYLVFTIYFGWIAGIVWFYCRDLYLYLRDRPRRNN